MLIKLGICFLIAAMPIGAFGSNTGKPGINSLGDFLLVIAGLLIIFGVFTLSAGLIQWVWTL